MIETEVEVTDVTLPRSLVLALAKKKKILKKKEEETQQ